MILWSHPLTSSAESLVSLKRTEAEWDLRLLTDPPGYSFSGEVGWKRCPSENNTKTPGLNAEVGFERFKLKVVLCVVMCCERGRDEREDCNTYFTSYFK